MKASGKARRNPGLAVESDDSCWRGRNVQDQGFGWDLVEYEDQTTEPNVLVVSGQEAEASRRNVELNAGRLKTCNAARKDVYDILSNRQEWRATDVSGPTPMHLDAPGKKGKKGKGAGQGNFKGDGQGEEKGAKSQFPLDECRYCDMQGRREAACRKKHDEKQEGGEALQMRW